MQIDARDKRLVIRWKVNSKPYSISFAGCNNPIGRGLVESTANRISVDIAAGYFDETLLKYKPQKLGKNPTSITAIELFQKYIEHRRDEGAIQAGAVKRLESNASKLRKFVGDIPAQKFTEAMAKNVVCQWAESANNRTLKAYLYNFKGCWDWGKGRYHIPDTNPWESSLERYLIPI